MSQAPVTAHIDAPSQRTHVDLLDFLRGVSVIEHTGAQADQLLQDVFRNTQVQQDAFVALADCGLSLVPLDH